MAGSKIIAGSQPKYEPEAFYIPGGVSVGRVFIIRGKVDYSAERFFISLQEDGDHDCQNIALHINPRQCEDAVVRNSRVDGDWQEEERDIPYFPFDQGKTFQFKIEVTSDEFRIYVNGRHFCNFGHRVDLGRIHYLFLTEGAEFYDVTFQNKHSVPFTMEIPGGMQPGKAIRVRGACTDSDGFAINFVDNAGCDQHMFHMNPRPNEGTVVRNANFGDWGDEERDIDYFPFSPGQYFDSTIMATDGGYEVYVNERHFTTFNHRCDVNDARCININGDVAVADVQYYEPQNEGVKKIPSGLEKGDIVSFKGYFKTGGERFSVNLMNGYDDDSDIAFHFNPRQDDGQVVLNNRFDGSWQEEERHDLPQVLVDKAPFEIKFIVKSKKFKVLVNGKKYCSFAARGNIEDIKGIYVFGDVFTNSVSLMRKLEVPHKERIPDGLHSGDWIVVKGCPKKSKGSNEHGLPQPAAPRGRDGEPPVYLPASLTKYSLHKEYVAACQEINIRTLGLSSFKSTWLQCLPHIRISNPRDDVCQTCEIIRKKISDAVSEEEKLTASTELSTHIEKAQLERDVYKQSIKCAFDEIPPRDEGAIPPVSKDLHKIHYTFDFSQQVTIPHHYRQMGPLYFMTPRRVQLFGVRLDGASLQYNYLIDEDQTIGKDGTKTHGPNSTISMLNHALTYYGYGEKGCVMHCDNCPGQNKNQYMLAYLCWRTMIGLHDQILLYMQVPGHTRFELNLQCDGDDDADIAMHFNPRFEEQVVVRNTRVGGDWQEEEREHESEDFPFEKKDTFEISINCRDDKFLIFVNGDRFAEYNYRIPLEAITHITMSGIADFFEPEFY